MFQKLMHQSCAEVQNCNQQPQEHLPRVRPTAKIISLNPPLALKFRYYFLHFSIWSTSKLVIRTSELFLSTLLPLRLFFLQMHLLNSWPFLVRHMKELANDLRDKADKVNNAEQEHISQRAVRQSQGSAKNTTRSLSQLTGQPAVFGYIHLWFTWVLGYEIAVEKTNLGFPLPPRWSPVALRNMCSTWEEEAFRTACFCLVTGELLYYFGSLAPRGIGVCNNAWYDHIISRLPPNCRFGNYYSTLKPGHRDLTILFFKLEACLLCNFDNQNCMLDIL